MSKSAADELLNRIEPLRPGARYHQVAARARELARTDPAALAELLAGLGGRSGYERRLAVLAAAATGHRAALRVAVTGPYPAVAGLALRHLAPSLSTGELAELLADCPLPLRRRVYTSLRRTGRRDVAAALLPQVSSRWGAVDGATLLAACPAELVAAQLPVLAHAVASWPALVREHPDVVAAWAEGELAAAGEHGAAWWTRSTGLLTALTRVRPLRVLDLLERYPAGPLPALAVRELTALLGADSDRVVRLLTAPGRLPADARGWGLRLSRQARRRLAACPDPQLVALARAALPADTVLADMLAAVAPARRAGLFDQVYADMDRSGLPVRAELLDLLPGGRRAAEARHLLTLRECRESPTRTDAITAYLPFADAAPRLWALTRRSDATERATGYRLLLECAARGRDPKLLAEVLGQLDRVPNEQDPVRVAVLATVASVSPALLTDATVDALDRLTRDALAARDRSPASGRAVAVLIARSLGQASRAGQPGLLAWSLAAAVRLHEAGVSFQSVPLDHLLPQGVEHDLFDRLAAFLTAAVHRNNPMPTLYLVDALGRRAERMPALQEVLGSITGLSNRWPVEQAIRHWLARPATRAERLGALAATDLSLLTFERVFDATIRCRPDLLDRVLSGRPLTGRFSTGDHTWIPLVGAPARQWSPRRRTAYGRLLRRGVADAGQHLWSRAAWLREWASLAGPDATGRYLSDGEPELVEAALGGLGALERPDEAIPVLLGFLAGDRARVAVPALARCARQLRPGAAGRLLAEMLATPKVTVRKEAVRLIAHLRVPGGVGLLADLATAADTHRDLRLAVQLGLLDRLDDEAAWAALAEGVDGPRDGALRLAAVAPWPIAPRYRPRFAALIRGLCAHPDADVRARALAALGDWSLVVPEMVDDVAAAVLDLDRPDWQVALTALTGLWSTPPTRLADMVSSLLTPAVAGPEADRDRDRPASQRLVRLVELVTARAADTVTGRPALRAAAARLWSAPTHAPDAVRLELAALPWESEQLPGALTELADRLAQRPILAAAGAAVLPGVLEATALVVLPVAPEPALAALTARGDLAGGLLALALLRWWGLRRQWPDGDRAALRALRNHPDPDVRGAARRCWTAVE